MSSRASGGSSGGGRGMITVSAGPAATADKTSDAISVIKAHIKTVAAEIKASIPVARTPLPVCTCRIYTSGWMQRYIKKTESNNDTAPVLEWVSTTS